MVWWFLGARCGMGGKEAEMAKSGEKWRFIGNNVGNKVVSDRQGAPRFGEQFAF